MLVGMKIGSVEKNAISPEMKRSVKAYDVLVGNGRICEVGRDFNER
jgi:hypothetical protein